MKRYKVFIISKNKYETFSSYLTEQEFDNSMDAVYGRDNWYLLDVEVE